MKINKKFSKDIQKLLKELQNNHEFKDTNLNMCLCNGYMINGYTNSYLYNQDNLKYKVVLEIEFDFKNDQYNFYIDVTSINNQDNTKLATLQKFNNIIDTLEFMQTIKYFNWKFSFDYFENLQ